MSGETPSELEVVEEEVVAEEEEEVGVEEPAVAAVVGACGCS